MDRFKQLSAHKVLTRCSPHTDLAKYSLRLAGETTTHVHIICSSSDLTMGWCFMKSEVNVCFSFNFYVLRRRGIIVRSQMMMESKIREDNVSWNSWFLCLCFFPITSPDKYCRTHRGNFEIPGNTFTKKADWWTKLWSITISYELVTVFNFSTL